LDRELSGILHRFLAACPDVIANGLREPAIVLEHTATYFSERDLAKQFAEDCLAEIQGERTRERDIEKAVREWLSAQRSAGSIAFTESHEAQFDSIMRDLAMRFPRLRARDASGGKETDKGNVRVWFFTGCRMRTE
jgi:hypothetical protein